MRPLKQAMSDSRRHNTHIQEGHKGLLSSSAHLTQILLSCSACNATTFQVCKLAFEVIDC